MTHHALLRILAPVFALPSVAVLLAPALADEFQPVAARYLAPEASSAGSAVAVGPDGTLHMAAATYNHGGDGDVIYATCAADCADGAGWTRMAIPVAGAVRAEIALTPDGAPRLLVIATAADGQGGRDFLYGECGGRRWLGGSAGCERPEDWSLTRVASSQESGLGYFYELLLPQQSFALDPVGNPRFVYTDSNHFVEPDHYGAFYMSCDDSCTDQRSWTETNLANQQGYSTEQFTRPTLAIGPSGSAHLLDWVYAFAADGTDLPDDLYYYECAADCTDRANWSRVAVLNPGSGSYPSPTWDLAVDPEGRPRAAVFVGGGAAQADLDHSLVYLWCDAACTSDSGWAGRVVHDESWGEGPALAIDATGRPRIAFLSPDALPVVAACSADCEGDAPVWNSFVLEGEPEMAAERPTAIPFTCDGEIWNALMPGIALDADGTVHVAYDVSVQARCLYEDRLEPEVTYYDFHEIWRGARLATMPPA